MLGYEDTLYRRDRIDHIAVRLSRVAPRVLRTRKNLLQRPPEQIRSHLKRAGFEHVTYILKWDHDWVGLYFDREMSTSVPYFSPALCGDGYHLA
ncbi:hypothetical protein AHAS_Ahas03G0167800 [Arachis hypogaea]